MSIDLFEFIERLDERGVSFSVQWNKYMPRPTADDQGQGSLMVSVSLPGARVEVEFFRRGPVQYSIFSGDESVNDVPNMEFMEILLDKSAL